MADDNWPGSLDLPGPSALLEAVGAFALLYNRLEVGLYSFLSFYLADKPETAMQIWISLHNRERVDLIKTMAAEYDDEDAVEVVGHAMLHFDLCCENRNLLLHAIPFQQDEQSVVLIKTTSKLPKQMSAYLFTLEETRAAVLDAAASVQFQIAALGWLMWRREHPDALYPPLHIPAAPRALSLPALEAARRAASPPLEPEQG